MSMEDKKAALDPQSYHGHGVQFQAVCTARSRAVYTYQQFGATGQREMCGIGFSMTAVAFLPFHVEGKGRHSCPGQPIPHISLW